MTKPVAYQLNEAAQEAIIKRLEDIHRLWGEIRHAVNNRHIPQIYVLNAAATLTRNSEALQVEIQEYYTLLKNQKEVKP